MTMTESEDSMTDIPDTDAAKGRVRESKDIIDALSASGHETCVHPNGLVIGVRFAAIPDTRGVHVDVALVIDLRIARFGCGSMAMRSALVESLNRDLPSILNDIGYGDGLQEKWFLLPHGRVAINTLRNPSSGMPSLINETRMVYVVYEDAPPTRDLSWLTDNSRILSARDFPLARKSDIRSVLPHLTGNLKNQKWVFLRDSLVRGWLGVLLFVFSLTAAVSSILGHMNASTLIHIPTAASFVSSLLSIWLFYDSHCLINKFKDLRKSENSSLKEIGDMRRLSEASANHENVLKALGDLNFIVSPLMASAADSLRMNDVDAAVYDVCSILDECVRASGNFSSSSATLFASSDPGLGKFAGMFEALVQGVETEKLALAYVALTGHSIDNLSIEEVGYHMGTLNQDLYNAGILRPRVKDTVDDLLNEWALKKAAKDLELDLSRVDEGLAGETLHPSISEESIEPSESEKRATMEMAKHNKEKSIKGPIIVLAEDAPDDTMHNKASSNEVIGADIVKSSMELAPRTNIEGSEEDEFQF